MSSLHGVTALQRPLLILDIDETLIHGAEQPLERECDLRGGEFYVYLRPYVSEFLMAVSRCYDLACWSSATSDYLEVIVSAIMSNIAVPLFVWDRKRCIRRMDFIRQDLMRSDSMTPRAAAAWQQALQAIPQSQAIV